MDEEYKVCLKILEVVDVLHKRGYELIRIFPYMAPSGCYWRCTISTKDHFDKQYGLRPLDAPDDEMIYYSTGAMYEYLEGINGKRATVEEIADEVLKRYPKIAEKGKGSDSDYMTWYEKLISLMREGKLPVAMTDYTSCFEDGFILCDDKQLELPKY